MINYDEISTEVLLDCLPQNIPLYKDSGLWMFRTDDMADAILTQRVNEPLRDFIIRYFKEFENNDDVMLDLSLRQINKI